MSRRRGRRRDRGSAGGFRATRPLTRALRAYRFFARRARSRGLAGDTRATRGGGGRARAEGPSDKSPRRLLDPARRSLKWSLWNLAVYELALGVVALVGLPPRAPYGLVRSPTRRSSRDREYAMLTSSLAILALRRRGLRQTVGPRHPARAIPLLRHAARPGGSRLLAPGGRSAAQRPRDVLGGPGVARRSRSSDPADRSDRAGEQRGQPHRHLGSPSSGARRGKDVPTKLAWWSDVAALGALVLVRLPRRRGADSWQPSPFQFTAIVCWAGYSSHVRPGTGHRSSPGSTVRCLRGGERRSFHLGLLATRTSRARRTPIRGSSGPRRIRTEFFNTRSRPRVPHRKEPE